MAKAKPESKSNSDVKYVYSTLTADVSYTVDDAETPTVYINGGANTTDKFGVTALGAETEVSADICNLLEENRVFKIHKENGFIMVSDKKLEIEVAVDKMEKRDNSAPDTPADAKQMEDDSKEGGLSGLKITTGDE